MFPLPIQLNNPGALRHADNDWVGMTLLQNNKSFVRFSTPKYGLRALMKTLVTYENLYGFNTIESIITRWAPKNENNTAAYIADVSKRTGIPRDVLIDLTDIDNLIKLAKAITMHESGKPPYDDMPPFWYTEATYHAAAISVLEDI